MATKIFGNINSALSALQSGETLVAQGDSSALRSATLLERASIAFNRKVLHREPQWLQQNNAAVGKALSKLLTESKKPLSSEEASRLTRTLRFAGLEQVAQVISDSQVKRPAPADFREAFERQNDVPFERLGSLASSSIFIPVSFEKFLINARAILKCRTPLGQLILSVFPAKRFPSATLSRG